MYENHARNKTFASSVMNNISYEHADGAMSLVESDTLENSYLDPLHQCFSVPLGPKKQSAIKEVIISLNTSGIQSIHKDYTDIKIYLHQLGQFLKYSNTLEESVYTLTKLEDKNVMEFNLFVKINHIKLSNLSIILLVLKNKNAFSA